MERRTLYEDYLLIKPLGTSDRAQRWLATEPVFGRYVQIKRFKAVDGADWQAQQRWFALLEQLRLLRAHNPAFTVPIERIEQDREGLWYTVSPWIEADRLLPRSDANNKPYYSARYLPDLPQEKLIPIVLSGALAVQSALALGQDHGLSVPIMHGFHDPAALLNTLHGGLLVGFDRTVAPTDCPHKHHHPWFTSIEYTQWRTNTYWQLAHAYAPHFGQWEPRLDLWSLGLVLRHLLALDEHRNPKSAHPHQKSLYKLAELAQPGGQLPNIGLDEFIETLHNLHGSTPMDLTQINDSQALTWLRAGAPQERADAFLALFNINPRLLSSEVVTDYAWHHFGRPFLQTIGQNLPHQDTKARVMASIPQVTHSLLELIQNPQTPGLQRMEAARMLTLNQSPQATQTLVALLNDPWEQVRRIALSALHKRSHTCPVGLGNTDDQQPTVHIQPCSFDWDDLEDEQPLSNGVLSRHCAMCERRVVRSQDATALQDLQTHGWCPLFDAEEEDLPYPLTERERDIRLTICRSNDTAYTQSLFLGRDTILGAMGNPNTNTRTHGWDDSLLLIQATPTGTLHIERRYPNGDTHTQTLTPGLDDVSIALADHRDMPIFIWRTEAKSARVFLIHRQNHTHYNTNLEARAISKALGINKAIKKKMADEAWLKKEKEGF